MATDTIDNNATDLDTKLNILADGLKATQDMMLKYAAGLTSLLSGQETKVPVRGRGRPRKTQPAAITERTPEVEAPKPQVVAKPAAEKAVHPISMEILHLVNKEGRITGAAISEKIDQSRSLTFYHARPLVEQGKIVQRRLYKGGVPFDVFYRMDRVSFKD